MLIRFSFFIKQKAKGNVSEFNFAFFQLSTVKKFHSHREEILTATVYFRPVIYEE